MQPVGCVTLVDDSKLLLLQTRAEPCQNTRACTYTIQRPVFVHHND